MTAYYPWPSTVNHRVKPQDEDRDTRIVIEEGELLPIVVPENSFIVDVEPIVFQGAPPGAVEILMFHGLPIMPGRNRERVFSWMANIIPEHEDVQPGDFYFGGQLLGLAANLGPSYRSFLWNMHASKFMPSREESPFSLDAWKGIKGKQYMNALRWISPQNPRFADLDPPTFGTADVPTPKRSQLPMLLGGLGLLYLLSRGS